MSLNSLWKFVLVLFAVSFTNCTSGWQVQYLPIPMQTPSFEYSVSASLEEGICQLKHGGGRSNHMRTYANGDIPGTGTARISLHAFKDIKMVIMEFNFRGLEQFRIQTEDSIYQVEIQKLPDEWRIYQSAASRLENDWVDIDPNSPHYTVVHIDRIHQEEEDRHSFELEIPKAVWQDTSKPFDLSWIDFITD
ncbi:MAG: hypothetical protein AAFP70_05310 [Calditrichota bacterium]